MSSLSRSTVTGSNAGIGYEAAKELAKRSGIVHMLCRSAEVRQKK
jgi:NAD(P)-dependent dehydrogenase (short-subunit alcohol dehydrogenase family)